VITYQREYLSDELIAESETLRRDHNQEVRAEKALKPDWERYKILEDHGSFVVYGVRDDSLLVGYACFIIHRNGHNTDSTAAYQDSIYVKPAYRKKGAGTGLLKYCHAMIKKFGVKEMSQMVLHTMDFSKVLSKMGYRPIGTIWTKEI